MDSLPSTNPVDISYTRSVMMRRIWSSGLRRNSQTHAVAHSLLLIDWMKVSGAFVGSACTEERAALSEALSLRLTEKVYVALVRGDSPERDDSQSVPKDGRRGKGTEAVTRYRRLHYSNGLSLLLVRPGDRT